MTLEEWERLESQWWDRCRVLGYSEICRRRRVDAKEALERALTVLENARRVAEKSREALVSACDEEEEILRVVARDDVEEMGLVALCLEEIET